MNEFFTWAMLATYAGALLATTLITQLVKGLGPIDKLPTRLVSYVIALVVLIVATVATGPVTVGNIGLCIINAVVVALAANGGYDAMAGTKKE